MRSLKKVAGSLLGLIWLTGITACRKQLPELYGTDRYPEQTFASVFEVYWRGMNHNYVFWDIDPTDWDAVYKQYQPLFKRLKRGNEQDTRKAYAYFQTISAGLIDAHYQIYFSDPFLVNEKGITPGYDKLAMRPDHHDRIPDNYFSGRSLKGYLDKGSTYASSGDKELSIVLGTIRENIGYFHSDQCEMSTYYYSTDPKDDKIRKQITAVLQMIKEKKLTALILDLRANYGGNPDELNFLLGRMTDKPYTYGSTRSKSGLGRLDFGPWMTEQITPIKGTRSLDVPIVVLTDMWTMSCAEYISAALRVRPQGKVTIIGERTFGATGPLKEFSDYNAGSFTTYFLEEVRMSSLSFRYVDGKSYEGVGFSPDIPIKTDLAALTTGRDPQLEKAISMINGK